MWRQNSAVRWIGLTDDCTCDKSDQSRHGAEIYFGECRQGRMVSEH